MAQVLEGSGELWESVEVEVEAPPWQPSEWQRPLPETDSKQLLRSAARGAQLLSSPARGKKKLIVSVFRASNLLASIFSISLDPFVKVLVGQEEQRTSTASGSSPEWNEDLDFMVFGTEVIIFSVWDHDSTGAEAHDFIARADLPLKHHVRALHRGEELSKDLELGNQIGDNSATLSVALRLAEERLEERRHPIKHCICPS